MQILNFFIKHLVWRGPSLHFLALYEFEFDTPVLANPK